MALFCLKTDGFPEDKPGGRPCKNLNADFRCRIHSKLVSENMAGCLAYDCFGAGQISYRNKAYVLETRVPVRGVIHLLEVHKNQIEKVVVYGEGHCLKMGIKKELNNVESAHVTSSGTNNVELMAKGCNKANTLK